MSTLLEEMQAQVDCEQYKSWNNIKCYKTHGDLDWYLLKCKQYGLEPKFIDEGVYLAKGDGFEFEYCEHDIVYAIN